MLESGEEHWAIKLLNEGMDPVGFSFPVWFFRTLITIPGLAAGYFKFIAFCQQQIENRVQRQGKQDVQDIAHYLVDGFEKSEDKKAALNQLYADSRLIIVAGSDTTAATLTHLFYHLAGDSSVVHKLREEIKAKMRAIAIQRTRRRMMAAVPTASVIVTNPTHYAVALKYDHGVMAAPIVVAKGVDTIALKIREVAGLANIPIVENRVLARALYAAVQIDHPVPAEYYTAVAEIIGFVMRVAKRRS